MNKLTLEEMREGLQILQQNKAAALEERDSINLAAPLNIGPMNRNPFMRKRVEQSMHIVVQSLIQSRHEYRTMSGAKEMAIEEITMERAFTQIACDRTGSG